MSGLLAGKVWHSALAPHLKPLAAVFADITNHDGDAVYPGVGHLAWLLGTGPRKVQYGLKQLCALRVLRLVKAGGAGRGQRTQYQFQAEYLPSREPWRVAKRRTAMDAYSAPLTAGAKGAESDTLRVQNRTIYPALSSRKQAPIIRSFTDPEDLNPPDEAQASSGANTNPTTLGPFETSSVPDPVRVTASQSKAAAPHTIRHLMQRYQELAANLPGANGQAPPLNGRAAKSLKVWLQVYTAAQIDGGLQRFFASREPFLVRRGHCWADFENQVTAFIRGVDQPEPTTKRSIQARTRAAAVAAVAENGALCIPPELRGDDSS